MAILRNFSLFSSLGKVNTFSSMNTLFQTEWSWWTWSLIAYAAIEINFYIVFHFHLIPRANQRTPPPPFRAFGCNDGKDRFMLLRRILDRLERTCTATGEDMLQATAHYLTQWFRFQPTKPHPPPPPMRRISSIRDTDSGSGSEEDSDSDMETSSRSLFTEDGELMFTNSKEDGCVNTNIFKWALHTLCYDDVNDLLSCFFFGKQVDELLEWEKTELKKMFDYLEKHFDLKVKPGRSYCCTPRLLTLEDVDPWHRPLAVYAGVHAFQLGKACFLWMMGFRHYVSTTGLQYWYRPARTENPPPPLLFFHGIAPGGSAIYIPMLLFGVADDGRALFIFENKPVSSHPSFEVLSEDETIEGVQEALDRFDMTGDISLMGHSFGSFQLTWLMYSPLRGRIRQFALLDPVSILLSEPDLIINFEDATPLFKVFLKELWTNFYIRRHFSWYRSELWLDDMPEDVDFFVGLAEKDQIVNGPKIRREVEIFGSEHPSFARQTTVAFWPKALHGDCLYQPSKWRDIRSFYDKSAKQKQS
jgi:hypothetical protein